MAQTGSPRNFNRARVWIDSSRWISLPNSAMPCILGGLTAFANGRFDWLRFIVALLGVLAVHLGTNFLDDYADLKIGGFSIRDKVKEEEGAGVRTAKAPYVANGTIKLQHVLYVALLLFGLGIMAGVYLALSSGWPVAALAAFGAVICFFYSMPPLKLSYRGLGETVVALSMGPGITLGTYYAVAQKFGWAPVFIGITIGLLIGTVLFVHSIMDFRPDLAVKKRTSVAYLGGPGVAVKLLPVVFFIAYAMVVAGIWLGILPAAFAILFLSLPLAIKLVVLMNRLAKGDYRAEKMRWWMGPLEMKIPGHEWFMVRWALARNLMIAVTLLMFIAYAIAMMG